MKSKGFLIVGITMAALLLFTAASFASPPSGTRHDKDGITKAFHLVTVDASFTTKAELSAIEVAVAPASQAEAAKVITVERSYAGVTVLTTRHECDVSPPTRASRASHGPPLRC